MKSSLTHLTFVPGQNYTEKKLNNYKLHLKNYTEKKELH